MERLINKKKIRILFVNFADYDNYNAQSLNSREIVRRLSPNLFDCTMYFAREPDPRLIGLPHLRLLRLPPRMGSIFLLFESIKDYDLIFTPPSGWRFSKLYVTIPKFLRRPTKTIQWLELEGDEAFDNKPELKEKYRRFLQKMDVCIAISDHIAKASQAAHAIMSKEIIPVGVDPQIFRPISRPCRKSVKVLFVGHFIKRKGPDLVLEAARTFSQAYFILVGRDRDNYFQTLQGLVKKYSLDNVKFLDPVPQTVLARLMARADILLHPSHTEGIPKVTLEAAATGLPCIIFDDYQSPSVINGVTGFQVQTFADMLNRLDLLLQNPELRLRMGVEAIQHARQFHWDIVARRWEKVFTDLVWKH